MNRVEVAILRTILYGDVFNFPMTLPEIHHFLIHDTPISLEFIQKTLEDSDFLATALICEHQYFALCDRAEIIDLRIKRDQASQMMWGNAIRYGHWLARLPFVRMVALTGALAMHNAQDDEDDYDYLVVTKKGRVWLGRLFAISLVYWGKLRGMTICPNYILAEDSLEQQRKDLYIAHEITQMIPIYGHDLYWRMREENLWAEDHLSNATQPFHQTQDYVVSGGWKLLKKGLEAILSGRIGTWLEHWEQRRKIKRFEGELRTPNASAQLDDSQVKGHFNDYGHPVLKQYKVRLDHYDVLEQTVATGD